MIIILILFIIICPLHSADWIFLIIDPEYGCVHVTPKIAFYLNLSYLSFYLNLYRDIRYEIKLRNNSEQPPKNNIKPIIHQRLSLN